MAETKQTLGREEEAEAALPHTRFTRGSARFLAWGFVATLLAVPCLQAVLTHADTGQGLAGIPRLNSLHHLPQPDELRSYEKDLEDKSVVLGAVRPRAQELLSGKLGMGNSEVCIGVGGWLFYRQGIDYITGEGFLDPGVLHRRGFTADQPDPVQGIVDFKKQLAARGIEMMAMPIPDKATIYPEKLWPAHMASAQPPQNVSYGEFVRRLTEAGVHVYDPTNLLIQAKGSAYAAGQAAGGPGGLGGDAEFFRADSHWTPATGELVALDMAHEINRIYKLPPHPPLNLKRVKRGTAQSADLLHLLGLPPNQKLFQADVRPAFVVTRANGTAIGVDKDADVLLLGDSFSGLYDDAGAGMAQHLALGLGRPVDVISVPNGGSWGARYNLVAEMRTGHDRLANKKLVIYEFVDRDLSFGDWKPAQLPKVAQRAAVAAAVEVPETAGAPETTHFRRRRHRHRRHRA